MELDLTQLIKLGNKSNERGRQAPNKPIEAKTAQGAYKTIAEHKKPLETKIEGLQSINKLQRRADANREDIYSLFLKACKAVSLVTSNDIFYKQLEADIRTIYGEGLLEPIPLQMEIQQKKMKCLI